MHKKPQQFPLSSAAALSESMLNLQQQCCVVQDKQNILDRRNVFCGKDQFVTRSRFLLLSQPFVFLALWYDCRKHVLQGKCFRVPLVCFVFV